MEERGTDILNTFSIYKAVKAQEKVLIKSKFDSRHKCNVKNSSNIQEGIEVQHKNYNMEEDEERESLSNPCRKKLSMCPLSQAVLITVYRCTYQ